MSISRRSKKIFAVLSAVVIAVSLIVPVSGITGEANTGGIKELIPGGMAFGVKFFTDGAIVLGTTGVETASGVVSPAKDAGLQAGDIIVRAGGTKFESANELTELIAGSGGKPIVIAFDRNGNEQSVTVTPARDIESGEFKMGVLVRDSTAGIGTVTYIDPETLDFGGLGHGIYDSETGMLLPLARGAVVEVDINGIVRSERNDPGELRGDFGTVAVGELWDNSEQGVFGRYSEMPKGAGEPIPIATRDQLTEGKATVITTLSGNETEEYEIEIEEIYTNSGNTKNFLVSVTDERLTNRTGGIVQGMSGSPIIQNGKLVGAITHVLVNDPLRGYGICIENMLESAYDVNVDEEYFPIAA